MSSDPLRKSALRQHMIQRRAEMDLGKQTEANQAIQKLVLQHWNKDWKTTLMYVNRSDEVATVPLILALIKGGKSLCVPAFDRKLNRYYPSELKDFEAEMESGKFGILEPKPSARRPVPISQVDVIFLPGVAFDRQGHRLGYGHGYFDQICRTARATKVALTYESQIVDHIPLNEGDVRVDLMITEKEVIQCPPSQQ